MSIEEFVTQVFAEDTYLQHLDVTEGTNLYDLLVIPLVKVIEEKMSQSILDEEESKLDLANYRDFTYSELLRFARNQFVEVSEPNTTRGTVTFYMSSPVEFEMLEGTKLYAGTDEFLLEYDIHFMEGDYTPDQGLYAAPPVGVINSNGVNIEANSIGSVDGSPDELIKIEHTALTSGVSALTITELYGLVKGSIAARQYLNKSGITNLLVQHFSAIKRAEIVGVGDSEMERDVLYNVASPNDNIRKISDFSGKIRGIINDDPIFVYNSNMAYRLFINDLQGTIDPADGIELTQQEYIAILDINNETITITTDDILNEYFEQSSEVGGIVQQIDNDLAASDTGNVTITGPTPFTVADNSGTELGDAITAGFFAVGDVFVDDTNTKYGIITNIDAVLYELTVEDGDIAAASAIDWTVLESYAENDTILNLISAMGLESGQMIKIVTYDESGESQRPVINVIKSISSGAITLYTKIGIDFPGIPDPSPYVEVLESAGYSLGNNWIKGEDSLALTKTLSDKEVMIVNSSLVLGTPGTDFKGNIVLETIAKVGIDNFLEAIKEALTISDISVQEETIPVNVPATT